MHKYKSLKSAGKASVRKQEAVEASYNEDGSIKSHSVDEELQVVKKCFDSDTGEAMDDSVRSYTLSKVEREIDNCKSQIAKIQDEQADWEQLETDLKAL